nr:CHAT domain-containing protein [Chloroflexia bacterium]
RLAHAHLLLRLERIAEADATLDLAEPPLRDADQATSLARLASLRAEVALAEGDLPRAHHHATIARAGLAELPIQAALVDLIAARIALAGGDASVARRLVHAASTPLEYAGIAPVLGDLHRLLGDCELTLGDAAAAYESFRRAVEEIERVRGTLQAERLRTAFLGDRLRAHEQLFLLALEREHGIEEAFTTAERARGRALLDSLAVDAQSTLAPAQRTPAEAALTREMEEHQAWLNWYYSQIGTGDEPTAHQRAELATHEQAFAALTVRLAVAGGPGSLLAPPATLAEVQPLLPDGTALVSYMIAGGDLHALVVTPNGEHACPRLAPATAIDDRVQRLHFQLNRALVARDDRRRARLLDDCRRELAGLHDVLLAPLARHIDLMDQLIVVPFGALHAVPFAALWDGERYQIEHRTVLTAPSASVLPALSARAGRLSDGTPLVVGVPDTQAPAMGREATAIAADLPRARLVLGDAATADRLLTESPGASLIHLACHGRFLPDLPRASGLRLADRWLSVGELHRLRTDAALITLSGCETGKSLVTRGDELVGLVRAMLAAGAGSLLVSLWMTHDEVTTATMSRFYGYLESGAARPDALRHAQLDTLASNPHPAFWAPFILIDHPQRRSHAATSRERNV